MEEDDLIACHECDTLFHKRAAFPQFREMHALRRHPLSERVVESGQALLSHSPR
ncbi:MAG: Paraquat-inducible protein A [Candidatus Burkholderia crenata]|nr:MAG: Paraquat-inducible protein A [Candidatus Burkholderia crenata]